MVNKRDFLKPVCKNRNQFSRRFSPEQTKYVKKLSNHNKVSAQRTKISVRKERLVSAKKPKER